MACGSDAAKSVTTLATAAASSRHGITTATRRPGSSRTSDAGKWLTADTGFYSTGEPLAEAGWQSPLRSQCLPFRPSRCPPRWRGSGCSGSATGTHRRRREAQNAPAWQVYRRLGAAGAHVRVVSAAHGAPHDDPNVEVDVVRGLDLSGLAGGYLAPAPGAFRAAWRAFRASPTACPPRQHDPLHRVHRRRPFGGTDREHRCLSRRNSDHSITYRR